MDLVGQIDTFLAGLPEQDRAVPGIGGMQGAGGTVRVA
jgi:hypothetical protein